jgi:hypothetical protein
MYIQVVVPLRLIVLIHVYISLFKKDGKSDLLKQDPVNPEG